MAYAQNGSVRLWWDEVGSGDPVLLVMGFAYPSAMWHRVWPAMSDQFSVIRFDNRGVGQSDTPKGPYSIAEMAADAFAVMDAARVERAHVFGASMGGGIVQEMALQHPERVATLVLGCTAAPDTPAGSASFVSKILRFVPPRILLKLGGNRSYGADVPKEAIEEDKAILLASNVRARGLIGQSQAIGAYTSKDRVHQITCPTLVIHGDQDKTVPVERGIALASLIPGARLEIIKGAGHNFITSLDSEANRLVREFWLSAPISAP